MADHNEEFQTLLDQAIERPGVREAMEVYRNWLNVKQEMGMQSQAAGRFGQSIFTNSTTSGRSI